MQHVSQFMTVSGALLPFTQGLEKYNGTLTKDYFRSTSHRGQECLKQCYKNKIVLSIPEPNGTKNFKLNVATVVVMGITDLHALRYAGNMVIY